MVRSLILTVGAFVYMLVKRFSPRRDVLIRKTPLDYFDFANSIVDGAYKFRLGPGSGDIWIVFAGHPQPYSAVRPTVHIAQYMGTDYNFATLSFLKFQELIKRYGKDVPVADRIARTFPQLAERRRISFDELQRITNWNGQ